MKHRNEVENDAQQNCVINNEVEMEMIIVTIVESKRYRAW